MIFYTMKRIIALTVGFVLISFTQLMAQCAMCRAAVGSNLGEGGNASVGASLNTGIIYLLLIPYLVVFFGIYFFRKSAKNRLRGQEVL